MKFHAVKEMTGDGSVLSAHNSLQEVFKELLEKSDRLEIAKQAVWDALRCATQYEFWVIDKEDGLMDCHINGISALLFEAIKNHVTEKED